MDPSLRFSTQTLRVLRAFLDASREWRYGYDLSRDTELKSGTLYPILMRLSDHGIVDARWEAGESGRPPRHLYRLTPSGVQSARAYLLRAVSKHSPAPVLRGAES